MINRREFIGRSIICAAAVAGVPACGTQQSSNTTGPSFGGLTSATPIGGLQVTLAWTPALSVIGGVITYNIYGCIGVYPDLSGQEQFLTSVNSGGNPTGATISVSSVNNWLFFVQAVDQNGNPDTNTVEPEHGCAVT